MIPRATFIAVLIGVEVAIVVGMVDAVRGSAPHFGGWAGRPGRAPAWTSPSSFPAGPHPALAVDVGMADVMIDAVAGPQIAVTVSDQHWHVGSTAPITTRDDGGTIRITASETDAWSFLGDSRTVHVTVPPATAVTIEHAGNIVVTGLRADATINSDASFHPSDGIRVNDFRGSLTATSPDGRVDVTDADCPVLSVTAANGRVLLRRVRAQRIEASSSNGRVDGTGLQLRDGRVTSSNGRVSLGFAAGADTTVSAASSNGHVNVSGLTVESGTANVNRGNDDDDDDSPSAKTVRVGAGSGRLDVRASNGSIDLSQEG